MLIGLIKPLNLGDRMKCKYCDVKTISGYEMNFHLKNDHIELDYEKVKIRKY